MIRNKTGLLLLMLVAFAMGVQAQKVTSMKLNEVLVINEANFVDDYGNRHGWIELYNNSAGTVDIRGCYLTDDKNNPTKYSIPKGDVLTRISPRQHVLFWADGDASKGTFHLNFRLDPDNENYVAFYDSDGKTLVDEVTIPAGQRADVSFGRAEDGVSAWAQLPKVTPSTNNLTLDRNEKIENFKKNDSIGLGMTMTAMAVVFLGLLLLYLVFKQVGKLSVSMSKRRSAAAAGTTVGTATAPGEISGEVLAAIGAALYELEEDVHDMENTVLTIQKVTRNYSPWSSKIYGLRELPK
ncbi:lamin tail domain-containing protein [Parabacteroides sp. OttesenSCG-928-N08]|nr:lamin tail domain-containing protein [Parabacteroides sp. OttesenSCG-928-N08]